jgi:hypothetical protein
MKLSVSNATDALLLVVSLNSRSTATMMSRDRDRTTAIREESF